MEAMRAGRDQIRCGYPHSPVFIGGPIFFSGCFAHRDDFLAATSRLLI